MARQNSVIDLTENDEPHQDRVNRLEATVEDLSERIDDLTNMVLAFMDTSNPGYHAPSSEPSAPVAPILTGTPPPVHEAPKFKDNAQLYEDWRASLLYIPDAPVYNGNGDPHEYMEAYLGWVAMYGTSDETKFKMFSHTLRGAALSWFGLRCSWMWDNWDSLAYDFLGHYECLNPMCLRKRNLIERPMEATSRADKRVCGQIETSSSSKGKEFMPDSSLIIAEPPHASEQTAPGLNSQFSSLETPAVAFTPIPGTYADLFRRLVRTGLVSTIPSKPRQPGSSENLEELCAYHPGMQGHCIEECIAFKIKVEELIKASHVRVLHSRVADYYIAILPYPMGKEGHMSARPDSE